jgi:polar amino acid transport system substrate-binding protein
MSQPDPSKPSGKGRTPATMTRINSKLKPRLRPCPPGLRRVAPKRTLAFAWLFQAKTVFFCFSVIFGLTASHLVAAQDAVAETQVLRIASEGARPPYNYFDNNELAGFEIDLGRELCTRMKVICKFIAQDWDGLIPGLLAHQYDAIMAAFEITDEARTKIAFTEPYIRMPSAMMGSKTNPIKDTSPQGLKGKSIGVEAGGAHQAYAEALYNQSEIRPYASLEEAILDLAEGRVDVVIGDKDALTDYLKTRHDVQSCTLIATLPRDPAFFGEGIAIGLRKKDETLKAQFEKALDATQADGTFAKIRAKYFDFEIK